MDGNISDTPPSLFVPAKSDRERWPVLQSEITATKSALAARTKQADADFAAWLASAPQLTPLPRERSERQSRLHVAPASSAAVAGPYGPATSINGLDLVLGPPVAMLRHGAESFGLLVRVDDKPSGTLLSCLDAESKQSGWELFLENGKVGLMFYDAKSGLIGRGLAKEPLAPGKWHHVFLAYDVASMRSRSIDAFVNGKPAASSGEIGSFPNDILPTAPLRLGSRHGADGSAVKAITGGDVWVQDFRHHDRGFLPANSRELISDKPGAYVALAFEALVTSADQRTEAQTKLLRSHYLAAVDATSQPLGAKLDALLAEDDRLRARGGISLVMEEKKDSEPFAHVLTRGEYAQLGEKVLATTPGVLAPLPADAPRNRLALARWLVDPKNPLTARVTVNRVWQNFFGTGIVESTGDFGVTGSHASHPELLDWLALDFRESGWDYRRLVRQMVTSATYRRA